ncbi:MAG: IMP cyclohydrolase [Oscillospiraceae bacterium]|nr:IMP cyclohydrolase [Oscillospiraceae bacterium]
MSKNNCISTLLCTNPYPGRGIVIGRSADNQRTIMLYFIMGRSLNSRNRVFERTEDGIRTQAHDPLKLSDPSLVIYNPVRTLQQQTIVTNGDQTDTIAHFINDGGDFQSALRTRQYEPDAPNYTPRISGMISADGSYTLSILKSAYGNPACCIRNFFEYALPLPGLGHFISTYQTDGDPLPSFEGEPIPVAIATTDGLESFAQRVWESLNVENKVSLYAREIAIADGTVNDIIFNKNV